MTLLIPQPLARIINGIRIKEIKPCLLEITVDPVGQVILTASASRKVKSRALAGLWKLESVGASRETDKSIPKIPASRQRAKSF